MNKKMPPGDGGISFGQIAAYLYAQARDTGSAR
jgi:hydrogenase maturation factor HypF (carbamoyltransferase family)